MSNVGGFLTVIRVLQTVGARPNVYIYDQFNQIQY